MEFVDDIVGGAIPREFIPACEKGFREAVKKGSLIGFPVVGVRVTINDGLSHAVDSSEMAFKTAALMAFREGFERAKAVVLEPVMKVEIEAPQEFQGSVVGQVNQRRGVVLETVAKDGAFTVTAEVPLNSMFGYSTDLRSATQGKGGFTMEFAKYAPLPRNEQEEMIKKAPGSFGRRPQVIEAWRRALAARRFVFSRLHDNDAQACPKCAIACPALDRPLDVCYALRLAILQPRSHACA